MAIESELDVLDRLIDPGSFAITARGHSVPDHRPLAMAVAQIRTDQDHDLARKQPKMVE